MDIRAGQPRVPLPIGRGRAVIDVVGAAIIDHPDRPTRLLAARRAPAARHAGRWELPGGKVDAGESQEAALRREVAEELGVVAHLHERVVGPEPGGWWWLTPPEASTAYRMMVWLATIEQEPQLLDSHDELRWLGPAELHSVAWLEGDVPIIRALADRCAD